MTENKQLLTPEQVSEILQVHILTVYDYIRGGKLHAVRLGRHYRVLPADLDLFLEERRVKAPAARPKRLMPTLDSVGGGCGY
jgi:excisionase family DNA binding protein